jgi:allantoinase
MAILPLISSRRQELVTIQKVNLKMTLPCERSKYSAIVDRPKLSLPNGGRVIVWTVVNVEVWDIARPMPRQVLAPPTGVTTLPDVSNWSWHEYGMRVGFWRFHALYERLSIRPTLSINGRVCIDYPRIAQACKDSGWEFMGHSYEQGPIHNEKDQPAMIARTISTIKNFTGKPPLGWMGPGLTETYDTPDYLKAAGIEYTADWVYDDEPTEIETLHGPLITLPYTLECNDISMMAVQHHEAGYWTQKCTDTFDRLYQEGAARPKVMAIAIHPYISGQPSRIKYLEAVYDYSAKFDEVLHWNGEQILNWYQSVKK